MPEHLGLPILFFLDFSLCQSRTFVPMRPYLSICVFECITSFALHTWEKQQGISSSGSSENFLRALSCTILPE